VVITGKNTAVGGCHVEAGKRGCGCLIIPEAFADGQSIEIPFLVVNGARPGPLVYVQVAQHGSEVQGLDAVRCLLEGLDETEMAGTLVYCLPNPLAFRERAGVSMFDPRPGGMNRIWPGDPRGSLIERMAYTIWTKLVIGADAVVDLHTGRRHAPVWVFYEAHGVSEKATEDTSKMSAEMARIFGAPLLYLETEPYGGRKTLRACCVDEGIPSIVPELGGAGYFDKGIVRLVVRGLRNIMVHMDMIDGEIVLPKRQTVLRWTGDSKQAGVFASKGGIFIPSVSLGNIVEKSEEIGVIYSPRTFEVLERLVAPQNGHIFSVRENPVVNAGDRVIAVPEIIEVLEN
jgi:predicted deacylase